jgi:hypothetical protein
MRTTNHGIKALIVAAALVCLALFGNVGSALAQCTSITVTNNLDCNLTLCLYNPTAATQPCFNIPTGGPTVINLPPGFIPVGAVSAAGAELPFGANGCTPCFSHLTTLPYMCCGVVCYNPRACTITIGHCVSTHCTP